MNKKSVVALMVAVIMFFSSTVAFASAVMPPKKTKQWYTNQSREACFAYGDYWAPNFRFAVKPNIWQPDGKTPDYILDGGGNRIALITCALAPKTKVWNFLKFKYVDVPSVACFDEAKPEFKKAELDSCQKPWLDYAYGCFDAQGNKIAGCSVPDPAV